PSSPTHSRNWLPSDCRIQLEQLGAASALEPRMDSTAAMMPRATLDLIIIPPFGKIMRPGLRASQAPAHFLTVNVDMANSRTGVCLCCAVRYQVDAPISELRSCHCRDCQRASGAGGTVGAAVPKSAFKVTKGTAKRFSKNADSGRLLHRHF